MMCFIFDKIKQFEQMCRSYLTDIKINNNSVVRWKDIATSNIIKNIQFLKNGVDIKKLKHFIENSETIEVPWFGQLMMGPQLLAYFYQIYVWGKIYHVELEL